MTLFVLFCLLALIGFFKKDSKFVALLIFVFAWILIGWNYESPDMDNYVWKYEASDTWLSAYLGTGSVEPGYSFLCYLGNLLGLSFMAFKQIMSAISFFLVGAFISRVGKNYALIATCYMVSILVIDVIQIRNFFAMAVLLFGFRYLLKPKMAVSDVVKYIVCVLIAASIHISMVFYLLFILARKPIKVWHLIILITVAFMLKATIFGFFTNTIDSHKVERYEGLSSLLGGAFNTFIFCANALFIIWAYNKRFRNMGDMDLFPDGLTLKNSNLMLLIVIPFLFDNGSYSRLLKDILIANYAYLSVGLRGKEKLLLFGYVIVFLIYYVFLDENRNQIFDAVFKYNNFFS